MGEQEHTPGRRNLKVEALRQLLEVSVERDRLGEINKELLAVLKQCLLDHRKFILDGDVVLYDERLGANMKDAEATIAKADTSRNKVRERKEKK